MHGGLVVADVRVGAEAEDRHVQPAGVLDLRVVAADGLRAEEAAVFGLDVGLFDKAALEHVAAAVRLVHALKLGDGEESGVPEAQLPRGAEPGELLIQAARRPPGGEGQHGVGLLFQDAPDLRGGAGVAFLVAAYDRFHSIVPFPMGQTISMWIVLFRTIVIYLILMLFLRLLGKRQLGEMELSEFVAAALIANLAAHPLEETEQPMLPPLLAIAALSVLELLTAWISLRSIRLRALLYGRPSLIIDHGKIDQAEMRRNRFTPDELMQAMRSSGVLDINEVLYAVLETNGTLSVFPHRRGPAGHGGADGRRSRGGRLSERRHQRRADHGSQPQTPRL